jgi:uncharacterized protein YbjT (DUF2867 family)
MERRILILGGTGLLGAPVARRLDADGFAVRVLTRDPDRARRVLGPSCEIATGDVGDPGSLAPASEGCWGVHASVAGPLDLAAAGVAWTVSAQAARVAS